jgi:hypothetical protein
MGGFCDRPNPRDTEEERRAWAEAEQVAESLRLALRSLHLPVIGLKVKQNVVGRPVVQLGTVETETAHELLIRLNGASTRTLYVVRDTSPNDGAPP